LIELPPSIVAPEYGGPEYTLPIEYPNLEAFVIPVIEIEALLLGVVPLHVAALAFDPE